MAICLAAAVSLYTDEFSNLKQPLSWLFGPQSILISRLSVITFKRSRSDRETRTNIYQVNNELRLSFVCWKIGGVSWNQSMSVSQTESWEKLSGNRLLSESTSMAFPAVSEWCHLSVVWKCGLGTRGAFKKGCLCVSVPREALCSRKDLNPVPFAITGVLPSRPKSTDEDSQNGCHSTAFTRERTSQ